MKTYPRRKAQALKIGIVTTDDQSRGLWRDTESLVWALEQDGTGGRALEPCLFPIPDRYTVEDNPRDAVASRCPVRSLQSAPVGTRFADWLDGLHALISCEYMMPRAFEFVRERGVGVAYVPNLDWAVLDGRSDDTDSWLAAVRRVGAQVWAKTPAIGRRLRELGVASHEVPWSIPDPVLRTRKPLFRDGKVRFLMNAGNGGYKQRRGVDIALEAFRTARAQNPALTLTLKTIPPLGQKLRAAGIGDGVKVMEGFYQRPRVMALYRDHDCVLHPSRWEGFGLPLLEALHAGAPVIGTDGWPMNELFSPGRSGIAVRASLKGTCRLAPWWECDAGELSAAMLHFAGDRELAGRMACADSDRLEERQRAFVQTVQNLLTAGEAPSRT